MILLRGESLNLIVRQYPKYFYRQKWYRTEPFAGVAHRGTFRPGVDPSPAVAFALAFVRGCRADDGFPIPWADEYVLTTDVDHNGDAVYVGNAAEYGGLQVHRRISKEPT